MVVANTAADTPFGPNPFDKTDSRFRLWQDAERDASERLASFQADQWRQMPPESAPPETFIKYKVAWAVGIFDAWAGPYCAMAAWNDDAEFHEDIFDGFFGGFAERLIKQVTPLGPSAGPIRAQALVSETRIALLQRRAQWKAEGFRIARQSREAFAKTQVQPVSAGNDVPAPDAAKRTKRELTADAISDLLDGKDAVSWDTAAEVLQLRKRQLRNLVAEGKLIKTSGGKSITTESIRNFLGPKETDENKAQGRPILIRHC